MGVYVFVYFIHNKNKIESLYFDFFHTPKKLTPATFRSIRIATLKVEYRVQMAIFLGSI